MADPPDLRVELSIAQRSPGEAIDERRPVAALPGAGKDKEVSDCSGTLTSG